MSKLVNVDDDDDNDATMTVADQIAADALLAESLAIESTQLAPDPEASRLQQNAFVSLSGAPATTTTATGTKSSLADVDLFFIDVSEQTRTAGV
jgi:hypothetical protein